MKLQTKYFGEIEYAEQELIPFPRGLFGFEDEKSFLLLPFSEEGTLFSLQSAQTPELAFTLMHPFSLDPAYAPVLHEEELKEMEVQQSEDLYYYVMCTVRQPAGESTVNMRCPVAINPDTRRGIQVVLDDKTLDMHKRLSDFGCKEAEQC